MDWVGDLHFLYRGGRGMESSEKPEAKVSRQTQRRAGRQAGGQRAERQGSRRRESTFFIEWQGRLARTALGGGRAKDRGGARWKGGGTWLDITEGT